MWNLFVARCGSQPLAALRGTGGTQRRPASVLEIDRLPQTPATVSVKNASAYDAPVASLTMTGMIHSPHHMGKEIAKLNTLCGRSRNVPTSYFDLLVSAH